MNPALNPYAPGAGARPPELAGRDEILESADVALARTLNGLHAQGQMLLGLRGVGKTVLLNQIEGMAHERNIAFVSVEAPEGQGLAALLVPRLRSLLMRLDRTERARDVLRKAKRVLQSFTVTADIQGNISLGVDPEPGLADSGDPEQDLVDLFVTLGEAAREMDTALALFIDEVQYLGRRDLGALIVALHRCSQKGLPVIFFGAGLPLLAGFAGEVKSYAERLFLYPSVGALAPAAAEEALRAPAQAQQVDYAPEAIAHILAQTQGYPYFLQEWGKHCWNTAATSPIGRLDAETATERALEALDRSFFRVRLDRMTPRERDYMYAMAALGPGPHRSGDVAAQMALPVERVAPLRSALIRKGMAYSPAHGDTAFTVPMFDEYLRRVMP